jgi:hypothetical protein
VVGDDTRVGAFELKTDAAVLGFHA